MRWGAVIYVSLLGFLPGCSSMHDLVLNAAHSPNAQDQRQGDRAPWDRLRQVDRVSPCREAACAPPRLSIGVLAGLHETKSAAEVSGLERFDEISSVSGGGTAAYWLYSKLHYIAEGRGKSGSGRYAENLSIDDIFRFCHTWVGAEFHDSPLPNLIAAELDRDWHQQAKPGEKRERQGHLRPRLPASCKRRRPPVLEVPLSALSQEQDNSVRDFCYSRKRFRDEQALCVRAGVHDTGCGASCEIGRCVRLQAELEPREACLS